MMENVLRVKKKKKNWTANRLVLFKCKCTLYHLSLNTFHQIWIKNIFIGSIIWNYTNYELSWTRTLIVKLHYVLWTDELSRRIQLNIFKYNFILYSIFIVSIWTIKKKPHWPLWIWTYYVLFHIFKNYNRNLFYMYNSMISLMYVVFVYYICVGYFFSKTTFQNAGDLRIS